MDCKEQRCAKITNIPDPDCAPLSDLQGSKRLAVLSGLDTKQTRCTTVLLTRRKASWFVLRVDADRQCPASGSSGSTRQFAGRSGNAADGSACDQKWQRLLERKNIVCTAAAQSHLRRKRHAKLHSHSATGTRRWETKSHFSFLCVINTSANHQLDAASGRSLIYLVRLNVKCPNAHKKTEFRALCIGVCADPSSEALAPHLLPVTAAAVVKTPECRCYSQNEKHDVSTSPWNSLNPHNDTVDSQTHTGVLCNTRASPAHRSSPHATDTKE